MRLLQDAESKQASYDFPTAPSVVIPGLLHLALPSNVNRMHQRQPKPICDFPIILTLANHKIGPLSDRKRPDLSAAPKAMGGVNSYTR